MEDKDIEYIIEEVGFLNKDYFTKQIDFEEYSKKKNEIYKEFKAILEKNKNAK
jgi:hypothetical protein